MPIFALTPHDRAPHSASLATDEEQFRQLMSHWPTGVSIVTSRDENGPVGCTVNAMMSLSVDPPRMVISLASSSGTLEAIRDSSCFAVNMLCASQRDLCNRFACGSPQERFADVPLRDDCGVPLLADAMAYTICEVENTIPYADHVLIIGIPITGLADHERTPLVLHRQDYRELA